MIRTFVGCSVIGSGLMISSPVMAQEPPREPVSPPAEAGGAPPPVEAPIQKERPEQAGRRGEPGKKRLLNQGAFRGPDRERPRHPEAGPQAGKAKLPSHAMPPRARIHHLKRAAEALSAAGYPEHAEKAHKEIKRLEEQAIQDEERGKPGPKEQELRGELQRMRKEIEELRQQVRRLKAAAPASEAGPSAPR